MVILFTGCGKNAEKNEDGLGNGWKAEKSMKVSYAKEFAVDYYKGGYKLIRLKDGSRYLLVPEGKKAPKDIDEKITIIQQPLDNIYLAASASMCLFDSLDSIDKIKFSGAERSQWSIPSAAAAMDQGKMKFAGKYNNPDYEMLMGGNCEIAIENTMINHNPDVKKKIEEDMPLISGGDRRRYICQLQKLMSSIFFYLPLSSSIFLYLPLSSSTTYWSGLTTTVAVPLMSYQTSPLLTTKAFTAEGISNKATRSTTCFLKRKEKLCVIILLFFCRS